LVTVKISPDTGEPAAANDLSGIFEIFLEDNVPTLAQLDNVFPRSAGQDNEDGESLF